MVVPSWLQVIGRVHPLVLHFPIVIIVMYIVWLLLARANSHYLQVGSHLLLMTAFTSAFTALCGLLLSKEAGYDADALQPHKWAGTLTSITLLGWYWFTTNAQPRRWQSLTISTVLILLVTIAGHLGANITHGENFIMAPVASTKTNSVEFEDAYVYADLVQPIFDSKCIGCHNSSKAKGQLVLETAETMLKGGKNGKLWDTSINASLLLQRLKLPEDEKEHMPPTGKPQLTVEELAIIGAFIKNGGDVHKKAIELPYNDTLRFLAYKRLRPAMEEYTFNAADTKTVEKLNSANRVIYPLALTSPGLVVNFYNAASFNANMLKELSAVSSQVVELNLNNMPVNDNDVSTIAMFGNLRVLHLNNTNIKGTSFKALQKLANLRSISLSGTPVEAVFLTKLQALPKLRSVFVWNTGLAKTTLPTGKIRFETGYNSDTVILKLTPPIVVNDESTISQDPLQLKHYINGTTIRYTIDGSEPDSTTSTMYTEALPVKNGMVVKARAVKNGWFSSDITSRYIFYGQYKADSAVLLQPADVKYRAKGGQSLVDGIKSDLGAGSGKWLGFRDNSLQAMLVFNNTVKANSVTLSMLQNTGAYIFPPAKVQVWGGANEKELKLLATVTPAQPSKADPNSNIPITCLFAPTQVSCLKIVAMPVARLPLWHPAKGEKAWLFVDEVLVN